MTARQPVPPRRVDAAELRNMLAGPHPWEGVLVDVRSAEEYASGHIPGARLIPLPELEACLDDLDAGRLHVFYCHLGIRSWRAAMMASAARALESLDLRGGIVAWRGDLLPGLPDLSVFADTGSVAASVRRAALLERTTGALYGRLASRFTGTEVEQTLRELAASEQAHAGLLESGALGAHSGVTAQDDLLESGGRLEQVFAGVGDAGLSSKVQVLELALAIEYAALDLYENLAGRAETGELRSMFSELARTERRHVAAVLATFGAAGT